MRQVAGGGNNRRKAFRLTKHGSDKAEWASVAFENLIKGDVAAVFEEDDTPVPLSDGGVVFVVMDTPKKDAEGVWGMACISCRELDSLNPG